MWRTSWTNSLRGVSARLQNLDALEVLPKLSVVLLLLEAPQVWYLQFPLTVLCVLGLAFRDVIRTTVFWYFVSALVGTTIYINWESADNHKYLICYWCLTLCCVFSLPEARRREALAVSSRILIGLCMAWAVFWKAITPSYMDGSFFVFKLLADSRFTALTNSLTDLSTETLAANQKLTFLLTEGYERGIELQAVALSDTLQVSNLAAAMTWWTILIEAVLAVLFLLPDRRLISGLRNAALLIFGVTTYAVAPVVGFGWILMLLGFAQAEQHAKWLKLAYLAIFLMILIYAAPFWTLAVNLVGRAAGY